MVIHGPRRIGKTMLARYIATGSGAKFVDMRRFPVDLKSGVHAWQEHDIRSLFRFSEFWTEKNKRPIVLFIDQFDEWLQVHGNIITQLEIELAGFSGRKQGVYIVATSRTNPKDSEASLFLGGRVDKWIAMSFPDKKQQVELL
ncbi:MAG: AAA family ATPase, partial [Candidatus Liptonbacteria bacterium]|nr:AAA family ATPase [Candidatus Liptonbacteria bacterium]